MRRRLRVAPAAFLVASLLGGPSPAAAHQGHTRTEPWEVCAAAVLGAACQWEDGEHALYVGTCQEVSGELMCVRNQPIVRPESSPVPVPPEWDGDDASVGAEPEE